MSRTSQNPVLFNGVRRRMAASARSIVRAVVLTAHPRPAAYHALDACCGTRQRQARTLHVVVLAVPVCTPLPDVADHVKEIEFIRLEATDRGARGIRLPPCPSPETSPAW